jgi:excisionase family DNA binding protein
MTKDGQESGTGREPAALLTYREVARRLGVPVGTVHYWVCRNAIPHVRLGPRSVRFRPAELELWLDERAVSAADDVAREEPSGEDASTSPSTLVRLERTRKDS